MKIFNRSLHPICILAVTCLLPAAATADTDYDRLVVFGDSLSDPGNAFALTGEQSVPPYGRLDDFLFWDGVHPTKAGYAILADTTLDVLSH